MPKIEVVEIKHTLTSDELLERSNQMVECQDKIADLKEQKKASASNYQAKIITEEAKLIPVYSAIRNRYEMREEEMEVSYNNPKKGMKTLYYKGTKDIYEVAEMDIDEQQNLLINTLGHEE